jgi:hypothetical protein
MPTFHLRCVVCRKFHFLPEVALANAWPKLGYLALSWPGRATVKKCSLPVHLYTSGDCCRSKGYARPPTASAELTDADVLRVFGEESGSFLSGADLSIKVMVDVVLLSMSSENVVLTVQ